MNETIKKDILDVLSKSINMLKDRDADSLSELSNHTIHNASVYQDEDSLSVAVMVYALSKIVGRSEGNLDHGLIERTHQAHKSLSEGDYEGYKSWIKKIFSDISSLDHQLKLYIQEVINQSEIKKGSSIYAHGISLGRACEILGISQWELQSYIGKTTIDDGNERPIKLRERIAYTRRIFRIK